MIRIVAWSYKSNISRSRLSYKIATLFVIPTKTRATSLIKQASNPPKHHKPRFLAVLDRMIASDLFRTAFAILLVLVVIIVSQKFIKILSQAIEGNVANQTVFMLLGLKTIIVTASFLPAAVFMAVLIVLGRMYKEQEIAAISSAGGGFFTLYRGLFLFLLPFTLLGAGLSMIAAPWAEATTQTLMHADRQNADIRGISAGYFREYSNGELIFYAEKIDDNGKMHKVFVQNKQGSETGIVNAEYGQLQMLPGGLYLVLEHGERRLGDAGKKDFTIETFQEYAVLVETHSTILSLNNQSLPTASLVLSDNLKDIAEFENRLNTPLGIILLGFLAVPLAKVSPRSSGIFGSLLIAFAIYFIFGNLQRLNYSWVTDGVIPVWLSYFWLNGLLLILSLGLVMRSYGWKWLWQSRFGTR